MRDVGSLNGTYVNRERIEEAVLVLGRRGADREVQARLPGGGGRVSAAGGDTVSSRTYLSIGDVLALLRQEFPDVTISKIRFLESQGLVNPERTPSGYRKFYEHDVERLRWVLRQQREHFLPLKVIKGRLEQEVADDGDDNGHDGAGVDDVPDTPSPSSWDGRRADGPAPRDASCRDSRPGRRDRREAPSPDAAARAGARRRPRPAAAGVPAAATASARRPGSGPLPGAEAGRRRASDAPPSAAAETPSAPRTPAPASRPRVDGTGPTAPAGRAERRVRAPPDGPAPGPPSGRRAAALARPRPARRRRHRPRRRPTRPRRRLSGDAA